MPRVARALLATALALVATPAAAGVAPARPQDGVTVTLLASEGVLLAGGGKRVIIDGLFLRYGDAFAMPADSTQRALHEARAPFDAVDLVLVTHRHGDHFHPAPVAAHLRANPRAILVLSPQTLDSLRHHVPASALVPPRYLARATAVGTVRRETVNGVPVGVVGIPHTGGFRNRRVEHLGFLVDIGGRRVLHLGDAEISERTLRPLRLDTMRIDVALLPVWSTLDPEGVEAIRRWIRPRQAVAIHLGPSASAAELARIQASMPGATVLARSLESHRW